MADTSVQTPDEEGRRERFLQRDLPVGYLMVRATMGAHMIAHGGVRLPILSQFAAETTKDFAGVTLLGLPLFPDWLVSLGCQHRSTRRRVWTRYAGPCPSAAPSYTGMITPPLAAR